ncbi:hypothetical protein G3H79_24765 [Streptomyces aureoverticillatus]|nr:hypothetical protein G3H79_24765 [Streptomyces aureoverticillatus]
MTEPRHLSCRTCGTRESHRPLTVNQKAWLRGKLKELYVEEYCMCAKGTCRNVRTYNTERCWPDPLKIPPGID